METITLFNFAELRAEAQEKALKKYVANYIHYSQSYDAQNYDEFVDNASGHFDEIMAICGLSYDWKNMQHELNNYADIVEISKLDYPLPNFENIKKGFPFFITKMRCAFSHIENVWAYEYKEFLYFHFIGNGNGLNYSDKFDLPGAEYSMNKVLEFDFEGDLVPQFLYQIKISLSDLVIPDSEKERIDAFQRIFDYMEENIFLCIDSCYIQNSECSSIDEHLTNIECEAEYIFDCVDEATQYAENLLEINNWLVCGRANMYLRKGNVSPEFARNLIEDEGCVFDESGNKIL